jgi:hypothetical protein
VKRLCWVAADTAPLQFSDHGKHVPARWAARRIGMMVNSLLALRTAKRLQLLPSKAVAMRE